MFTIIGVSILLLTAMVLWCAAAATTSHCREFSDEEQIAFIKR